MPKTRRGGDKDKDKMLEVAPASTKEPLPDPPRGCHRPCRVTSGAWGTEVTATTLSAPGGALSQRQSRAGDKGQGTGNSLQWWGGGSELGHSAVTRVPKLQHRGRDGSHSPQTASHKAPEAGTGGTQSPAPPEAPQPPRKPPKAGSKALLSGSGTLCHNTLCHAGSWGTLGTAWGRWHSPGWLLPLPVAGSSRPGTEPGGYFGYFYPGICVV